LTTSAAKSNDIVQRDDHLFPVPQRVSKDAKFSGMDDYKRLYEQSIRDPNQFWAERAKEFVTFFAPYSKVSQGSFVNGDVAWFVDGKLNVTYNCLDRHLPHRADQVAIVWEGDEPTDVRHVTYAEALRETCRLANVLLNAGVTGR
jgi:acetyl-CoA synthetase